MRRRIWNARVTRAEPRFPLFLVPSVVARRWRTRPTSESVRWLDKTQCARESDVRAALPFAANFVAGAIAGYACYPHASAPRAHRRQYHRNSHVLPTGRGAQPCVPCCTVDHAIARSRRACSSRSARLTLASRAASRPSLPKKGMSAVYAFSDLTAR